MRDVTLALCAVCAVVSLPSTALSQNRLTSEWISTAETGAGSLVASALPDIDPLALAQCRAEAAKRKLTGEVRQVFIEACVDPEGQD